MVRDSNGIIIQGGDPVGQGGGDSAFTTGIMAGSGSKDDLYLMPKFIIDGKLVRHPFESLGGPLPHNDPKATSRDQVLAFFFGISQEKELPNLHFKQVKIACLNYAKGWFINSDIILFNSKFYLYKCAGVKPPLWLYPLAYLNQFLMLLWDIYIKPDHEMNQSVCMNIVFGKTWIRLLNDYHPNLYKNITDYFSGWRDKKEVGELFTLKINVAVNK